MLKWNYFNNLILEERVQNFEQNSENLIENQLKNKEVMTLWNFANFQETFLDQSIYEYANEWVDDVIASQFSIHLYTEMTKNFIFQLWEC